MKLKYIIISLFLSTVLCNAQQPVDFVTYGAFGDPKEGDDDFKQIFFIKVSPNAANNFSLEIFDIDCGGKNDVAFGGKFDSEFQFSLYGGKWAYTSPTITDEVPKMIDIKKGKLLHQMVVAEDDNYDDEYTEFAEVNKRDGELVNGYYYFKLVVEGISGNDANVFNLKVDGYGVEIISYSPTIHLTPNTPPVQLRFFTSDLKKVHIRNFDGDNAKIYFVSPYKEPVKIKSSRNGLWDGDIIYLEPYEQYETCAVQLEPVGSVDNDIVIDVRDEERKLLPISLPFRTIVPNSKPVVDYNIRYLENCRDVIVSAVNSYDPDGGEVTVKWMTEAGWLKYGFEEEYDFNASGKYRMLLAVKDKSDAVESGNLKEFYITINNPPIAKLGDDIIAAPGDQIKFDGGASTDSDGWINDYEWNFGDGNFGNEKAPVHGYLSAGNYKVQLTITDNFEGGCNTDTTSLNVKINEAPVAVAGNDITCAVNEILTFDGSESLDKDGFITSYEWSFSDNTKAEGAIVQTSFPFPGKYTATLKVKDNTNVGNNTSVDQINIFVNSKPVADAGIDKTVAVGELFTLDASKSIDKDGSIIEYVWDYDGNVIDSSAVVEHQFSKPGKYKVNLRVKDNSGTTDNSDEQIVIITVNAQPVANAGEDVNQTTADVSFNAEKSFDPDGEITNYYWDFGDGSGSNKIKPNHFYSSPGIYNVILTVTDNSLVANNKASDTLQVKINAKPIADAGPDIIVSPNEEFILSAENSIDLDGEIKKTLWLMGNDTLSREMNFKHKFNKPGAYSITLLVSDNSNDKEAISYDEVAVKVNNSPVIVTSDKYTIAVGETIKFDASNSYDPDGEIESYEWSLKNKIISTKSNAEYTFNESGNYKLKFKITDYDKISNSTSSKDINVFVNSSPVIQQLDNIITCSNTVNLSALNTYDPDGDNLSFMWKLGDGIVTYGKDIIHNYQKPGSYPVVLTVDDGNNLSNSITQASFSIKINSIPVAVAGVDEVICTGDIVTLDASKSYDDDGDLLKYEWDLGDSTIASGISVTKSYGSAGLYMVSLKVSDNSGVECSYSIDTKVLKVVESPVAYAGEDLTGCANSEVFFDASKSTDSDGIVNSFVWDFGDGSTGGGVKTSHVYKKAGRYNVNLTITGELVGECDNTDTDELIVTITEAPTAEFNSSDSAAVNENIIFDASASDGMGSNITLYNWDMGDETLLKGKSTTHSYKKSGNYIVTLSIDSDSKSECKSSSIRKSIYINDAPVAVAGDDLAGNVNEVLTFDASSSYDPNGRIIKYIWDFGDGESEEGIRVHHAYTNSGNYSASLKVIDETNIHNNYAVDDLFAKINAFPSAAIEVQEYGYVGQPVNIRGINILDNDGKVSSAIWKIADYTDSISQSFNYIFEKSGMFDVVLNLTDNNGAVNEISKSITIYDIPEIEVDYPKITCLGETAKFALKYLYARTEPNLTAHWFINNQNIYRGNIFNYKVTSIETSEIVVHLIDSNFPDLILRQRALIINVNQKPIAKIKCDDKFYIGGANDLAVFDGSDSFDADGNQLSFIWDFGDGYTTQGIKVIHQYVNSGNYVVTLTVDNGSGSNCSSNEVAKKITVERRK